MELGHVAKKEVVADVKLFKTRRERKESKMEVINGEVFEMADVEDSDQPELFDASDLSSSEDSEISI